MTEELVLPINRGHNQQLDKKKKKKSARMYKWAHCALSQHVLTKPVVACEMGKLYNKETIIELLLSEGRSQAAAWIEHVEKLKDVVELKLTPNPEYQKKRKKPHRYDPHHQCQVPGRGGGVAGHGPGRPQHHG